MIRDWFPRSDLVSSCTRGGGEHSCFQYLSQEKCKTPILKGQGKGETASKSSVEPEFSHCCTGCNLFNHAGRKCLLLDGRIYSSQSWSGRHIWTHVVNKQDLSLPLCASREEGQNVPGVYFPMRGDGRIDITPTHIGEGGGAPPELWGSLVYACGARVCIFRFPGSRLLQCTWTAGCSSRPSWQEQFKEAPTLLGRSWSHSGIWGTGGWFKSPGPRRTSQKQEEHICLFLMFQ